MLGELLKKIKAWYKGDPGDMKWDPITDTWVGSRGATRHWAAKSISKIFRVFSSIIQSIKNNPNTFTTQLFAFIAILLSIFSLYFQLYRNDDEYKRCSITHTNKYEIALNCKK